MQLDKKHRVFGIITLVVAVATLELLLRLLSAISPQVYRTLAADTIAPAVPDAHLGHRPNPTYPGHDAKGFRNVKVPARANIVAMGDSQTYGYGVDAPNAWPQLLHSMTGQSVYSMAYGGYGPTHHLFLLDEAMALSPKTVIVAFYSGNDLFDAFDHVYNRGQLSMLRSPDPELQARLMSTEQSDPIAKRVAWQGAMRITPVDGDTNGTAIRDGLSQNRSAAISLRLYGLWRWVRATSLGLVKQETLRDDWESIKAFAQAHPQFCQIFINAQFKTIFTSEYRLSALNLTDARIVEGLNISLRALQRIRQHASHNNYRFLVVWIPTKEAVFRELWQKPALSFWNLSQNEARVWQIAKEFFDNHRIDYLDALPALREQLASGTQPFPISADGHLNEHGHRSIAQLVAAWMKDQQR